ncbi:hypothetical protein ID866_5113 [Astraeus odoratus]|nr:hypothetical protein ID866_5113 [Astraeus odoratus]
MSSTQGGETPGSTSLVQTTSTPLSTVPGTSSSSSSTPLSASSPSTNPLTSAATPTTTTTSATPTTSETPTAATSTTPQTTPTSSNNGGGSSSTTSPSSGSETTVVGGTTVTSAAAATTSSASTPTSTEVATTVTSQVPTTYLSTNAAGSTVVITTNYATVVPTTTTISTQASASSSTPTAAIVGGVVGGIAFLIGIAVLIFCVRRRSYKDDFDGDFDPDRVVHHSGGGGTLPQLDLVDDANNITPFNAYAPDAEQGMRQYGQSPLVSGGPGAGNVGVGAAGAYAQHQHPNSPPPPSSPSHYSDGQSYFHGAGPSGGHSPQNSLSARPPPGAGLPNMSPSAFAQQQPYNMYGTAPADWHTPRPGSSPPPSTVPSGSSRSAKEREAMGERGGFGLGLATQHEVPEGSSSSAAGASGPGAEAGGSGRVVVHQDAGRAPEGEEETPQEIPPSYDSIQQ